MKNIKKFDSFNEAKWIQEIGMKKGALKKSLGKEEGEKLTKTEINAEIADLKKKDKDPGKKGVQGLSKKDLTKYKRLNLAKTLSSLKEHQTTNNYMFFANLETMQRYIDAIMELPQEEVDSILSEHDWASDHISVACENLEHVHNFLLNHEEPHHHEHGIGMDDDHSHMEEEEDEHEEESSEECPSCDCNPCKCNSEEEESHEEEEESGIKGFEDFQ